MPYFDPGHHIDHTRKSPFSKAFDRYAKFTTRLSKATTLEERLDELLHDEEILYCRQKNAVEKFAVPTVNDFSREELAKFVKVKERAEAIEDRVINHVLWLKKRYTDLRRMPMPDFLDVPGSKVASFLGALKDYLNMFSDLDKHMKLKITRVHTCIRIIRGEKWA